MLNRPYLIFDFDGTLADSIKLGLTIANDLSHRYGYPPLTEEDIDKFRGLPLIEAFKHLQLPFYQLPFFVRQVKLELSKRLGDLQPFPDIPEVLQTLQRAGIPMSMLTSNSYANVMPFLIKHGMDVFDWYVCDVGLFRKSRALTKQIKRREIGDRNPVYIGDEQRDIRAAKHNHIPVISVTWGLHPRSLLEKLNPEYLIGRPRDLIDIVGIGS
ncbi:MAG: HAD hydrolase-like protein [Candidatus Cloacimonetes bacterium]|nr:HAD hydrolase-like protein [Candidatus Cloacimonadota bacterium]